MAQIRINRTAMDQNWEQTHKVSLDLLGNAKVLFQSSAFQSAKKVLTASAVLGGVAGVGLTSAAFGVQLLDVVTNNYEPSAMSSTASQVAQYAKQGAVMALTGSAMAGVTASMDKLVNKLDEIVTKLDTKIEASRFSSLVEAYGWAHLVTSNGGKNNSGTVIDDAYKAIEPIAEALGYKEQAQKDGIFYGWLNKEIPDELNEPMKPGDPGIPEVIGKAKGM